ncbi:hypothetical protein MTR67_043827 [Solanum verrucosum]|uniref:Uncharacterized protein n=1 Tax=Solanum verrucosum TaxID=315347 RepID=A0AAF0UQD0_SOLVR|nr:hypothetical protein MTR67_043827 [Solanum verrucosum]
MSILYNLGKANVVADAFSRLSMHSVAHIEDDKKKLVCDVHILSYLGVCMVDLEDGGVIVQNGSESSPVSDVKENQDNDPNLIELKNSVSEKAIETFSQEGKCVL